MTAVLLAVAFAAGYGLGRWRPWSRLGDWVHWQLRLHVDERWHTRPRQAVLFVLLLATAPKHMVRSMRRRNDP
ncbi:hypothetical protein K378_01399 [Streptomyces sp. Amel2xB2]|uniref:hypothetical protein n=1 Tax=Streptomyces sp. Amel2xB2 TaxID=1305829 RepID=UPI000DBA0E14|nr:hypothetical protein [Streptomyces sp. Amel2xB2]RAJ70234.1 hypothetical protein K378_01399 [Streptomyces sp. Amel2xB2]